MDSSYPWKLLVGIQTNTTQVITEQIHLGLESPFFTDITMFTYIIPVKCNIQTINGRKAPVKGSGIVIVYISKKHYYTTLVIILYATKPTKYNK